MFVRNGQKLGSVLVDKASTEPEPAKTTPTVALESEETVEPARYAPKGDWVDYAVSHGATREEAEASTKDALVEAYGTAKEA